MFVAGAKKREPLLRSNSWAMSVFVTIPHIELLTGSHTSFTADPQSPAAPPVVAATRFVAAA
jgi:hypothetical protein